MAIFRTEGEELLPENINICDIAYKRHFLESLLYIHSLLLKNILHWIKALHLEHNGFWCNNSEFIITKSHSFSKVKFGSEEFIAILITILCAPSYLELEEARDTVMFSNSGESAKGFLSSEMLTTNESTPLEIVFLPEECTEVIQI